MEVKNIYFDDFINVGGHCALTIAMPHCSFKCGKDLCQNTPLAQAQSIMIEKEKIIQAFEQSNLMDCICFQGLEPFDSWHELKDFISTFRKNNNALIAIYTGYNKEELTQEQLNFLTQEGNIIIKYGRFIPNQQSHYDEVLKVNLASDNQYAEVLK